MVEAEDLVLSVDESRGRIDKVGEAGKWFCWWRRYLDRKSFKATDQSCCIPTTSG
jgi:hypothetical protein